MMPSFPKISECEQLRRLMPPEGKIRAVLDTDAANEVDDQFAIVYSLLSKERFNLEAIYAAPYVRGEVDTETGMERSYRDIVRVLGMMHVESKGVAFRGSPNYLTTNGAPRDPHRSEAVMDLISRAMASDKEPLYVMAIGAITNIASAILIEPRIIDHIVLVWNGGAPLHFPSARIYNIEQDLLGSRVVFDCGVPLVHLPHHTTAGYLLTTIQEVREHVKGKAAIGDHLYELYRDVLHTTFGATADHFGFAWGIWDFGVPAYLVNSDWVQTEIVHSPVLTDQCTWSFDNRRHFIRNGVLADRNPVFQDFFTKLGRYAKEESASGRRL